MKLQLISLLLILGLLLAGCGVINGGSENGSTGLNGVMTERPQKAPAGTADLGDDDKTFGEDLEAGGAYDGFFEGDSLDVEVECLSGTKNAYRLDGTTLTFTAVSEDTVYAISGTFNGSIVIDAGDSYRFDLELHGFSQVSASVNPITVKSGSEVTIKAKKDCENYIYDTRAAVDPANEELHAAAIYSLVDLEIGGKGMLTLVSEHNNGIHSKDDLQVKNLTLKVVCLDNALKGNDSVEITDGALTLIASAGDCIKTTNSDISEKGNQRGSVTVNGGAHTLYAACDGIDAAYNVDVMGEETQLNIYTDKYSNYSQEVTAQPKSVYYIRYSSQKYSYSVKFVNSESGAHEWVNAEYHSKVSGGRTTYYYYSFPKKDGYDKLQLFVYSSGMAQQQEETYSAASDVMTLSTAYDTIALSSSGYSWTNYTTTPSSVGGFGGGPSGGPGGMQDGNTDKGDHSTKGIKACNEILIQGGVISIKSYDDAIHANNDTALENGASPLGNVTVSGGTVTAYSNDDGLHAAGTLAIQGGTVSVVNAYEGLEGTYVRISGGQVSVNSKDDGINATTSTGTAIEIGGGQIYIYCTGDGIDSNSRSSYSGIVFSGGNTVVISNSSMNSAIDSEQGYAYTGGNVVAVMPRGGMSDEAKHCQSFNSVGKAVQLSLTSGGYLQAEIGSTTVTVRMPVSLSAVVVVLGDSAANVKSVSSFSGTPDENGVAWS